VCAFASGCRKKLEAKTLHRKRRQVIARSNFSRQTERRNIRANAGTVIDCLQQGRARMQEIAGRWIGLDDQHPRAVGRELIRMPISSGFGQQVSSNALVRLAQGGGPASVQGDGEDRAFVRVRRQAEARRKERLGDEKRPVFDRQELRASQGHRLVSSGHDQACSIARGMPT
jgi:hypothetical protein